MLLTVAVLLTVVACAQGDVRSPSGEVTTTSMPPAAPAAPGSTPGPAEKDLPPGWDEPGDGPTPAPADALAPEQLRALLRLPATGPDTATTCADVEAHVTFVDAALGHRFGVLTVENTGQEPCELVGYPGLGGRGTWGSTFQWALEQRDPLDSEPAQETVVLAPGAQAVANLEWTGELAGAEAEHLALAVVQLAAGTEPVTIVIDPDGPPGAPDSGIDIGMATTVRVGPFTPAPPPTLP